MRMPFNRQTGYSPPKRSIRVSLTGSIAILRPFTERGVTRAVTLLGRGASSLYSESTHPIIEMTDALRSAVPLPLAAEIDARLVRHRERYDPVNL
jgi:hypothetical protein